MAALLTFEMGIDRQGGRIHRRMPPHDPAGRQPGDQGAAAGRERLGQGFHAHLCRSEAASKARKRQAKTGVIRFGLDGRPRRRRKSRRRQSSKNAPASGEFASIYDFTERVDLRTSSPAAPSKPSSNAAHSRSTGAKRSQLLNVLERRRNGPAGPARQARRADEHVRRLRRQRRPRRSQAAATRCPISQNCRMPIC